MGKIILIQIRLLTKMKSLETKAFCIEVGKYQSEKIFGVGRSDS